VSGRRSPAQTFKNKKIPESAAFFLSLTAIWRVLNIGAPHHLRSVPVTSKIYLSDKELADRYGVIRGTIWRWVSEGRLPAPVHIGPNTTRWRLADLEEHERQFAKAAPAGLTEKPTAPR